MEVFMTVLEVDQDINNAIKSKDSLALYLLSNHGLLNTLSGPTNHLIYCTIYSL